MTHPKLQSYTVCLQLYRVRPSNGEMNASHWFFPFFSFSVRRSTWAPLLYVQQQSARVMPVSRASSTGMRRNQGLANPVGVTGFDAENPFNIPAGAARQTSEQEHADPGVDTRDSMSILTFLKIVSTLNGGRMFPCG